MQSVSSRIWTRVAVSISYEDNDYTTGTFIDSSYMKTIIPFEVISSGCNALALPFQQLLEVLLCERVNDLRHSLFHLFNCLITTDSELRE